MRPTLFSVTALLFACGEKEPNTDTDTGNITEEEEVSYESGCFVVDGGDGYKYLNDAIAVADVGSQISPVGCDSNEHEEKIIIDKAVRLVGIGQDRFTLVAPVNEAAITIQSEGVEISDLAISSTRSGIVIESGSDVNLHDLTISNVGNYAIKSIESTTELADLTLWMNGDGAIQIDGGSVTASGLDLEGNTGVGIAVDGGSSLTLSDSRISETQPTDMNAITDGFGVYVTNSSSFTSDNNTYTGNVLMGVQAVNGTISLSNDTVSGSLSTGVWAEGTGGMYLDTVTVEGNLTYGIVNQSPIFNATDVVVSVDPTLSPNYAMAEWEDSGFGSMGVFANSNSININNLEVTGYNNCGVNLQNQGSTDFTVAGLNIHDVGRKGMILAGFEGSMNNVVIKDIFDLDGASSQEPDEEGNVTDWGTFCSTVDQNIGALVLSSDITVSNLLTEGVQGYGWTIIQSNMTLDTAMAQNNTCASFIAFQGGLQASNVTVANSNPDYDALGSGMVAYAATLFEVDNSNLTGDTTELFDINAYVHESSATFTNTSFNNGGIGIYSYDSSIDATGNTFTGHSNYSLFLSSNTSGSVEHNSTTNTFIGSDPTGVNTGAPVSIYCNNSGTINSSGDTFQDVTASYAFYSGNCNSEIEDATFTNISGYSLYLSNGDHSIENTTFSNVSTVSTYAPAMYFYASSPMNIAVSDVTITDSLGDGFSATTFDSTNSPVYVDIDGLSMNNVADDGVYLYGVDANIVDTDMTNVTEGITGSGGTWNIDSVTIDGATDTGINNSQGAITLNAVSISNTTGTGMQIDGSTLSATALSVLNSSGNGLESLNDSNTTLDSSTFSSNLRGVSIKGTETSMGTFNITNSTFALNIESGLFIEYADGTADSNMSNNNQNFGMECNESTFTTCDSNDLSSNVMGEQTGCDSTCGVEANPPITE